MGVAGGGEGGLSFEGVGGDRVVDRAPREPFLTASPFVLREGERWRMWYASASGWVEVDERPEPVYTIMSAESGDGISWQRDGRACIPYGFEGEANARPVVLKGRDLYRMWYCSRGSFNYRIDKQQAYRLGYAESVDGESWVRKDHLAGLERSESGWDSEMIEYPYVCSFADRTYLFYNGNGFGLTGFGYAELDGRLD